MYLRKLFTQKGFTLLEVLASVVILTIVLTTFFSFFSQSLVFSNKNGDRIVAYNLAQKTLRIVEMEYNRNIVNDHVITCSDYPTVYPNLLINELEGLSCFYEENDKYYYPEVTITKQTSIDFTKPEFPVMYLVHIKIFDSDSTSTNIKLAETFGYIRGKE
ncbi:type IV pilus modification PilV family protein [Bacillus sp. FJAT-45350]|uniref:type IV pilus modification PilV family protein n=1 Tax=Bacillus sp. FJAT-45350 TaxID=2011014 RepID=UPI0015CE463A|nr:type II secretion system protein [Bacillus sp. FJAT-45350]